MLETLGGCWPQLGIPLQHFAYQVYHAGRSLWDYLFPRGRRELGESEAAFGSRFVAFCPL